MNKGRKSETESRTRMLQELIESDGTMTNERLAEELTKAGIETRSPSTVSRTLAKMGYVKRNGQRVLLKEAEREERQAELADKLARYSAGPLEGVTVRLMRADKDHGQPLAAALQECGGDGVVATVVTGDAVLVAFRDDELGSDAQREISRLLGGSMG